MFGWLFNKRGGRQRGPAFTSKPRRKKKTLNGKEYLILMFGGVHENGKVVETNRPRGDVIRCGG